MLIAAAVAVSVFSSKKLSSDQRMCGGGSASGREGKGITPFYLESEVRDGVTALGFSGGPLMTYSVEVDLNSPICRSPLSLFYLLPTLPP